MSKKSKVILSVISFLIFLFLIVYALLYYVYGFGVNQEICCDIKEGLVENVTNIQVVDYDWLNSNYKSEITKDDFRSPQSTDEYLALFQKINSVNSKANFFQQLSLCSTDYGKKTASQKLVSNDGNEYLVTHHINMASTLLFKPQIVEWTVDIYQITAKSTSSEISSTITVFEEKPAVSNVTQDSKAVDFSSKQNALKDYINFACSGTNNNVFEYGCECIISLQNIFGDEKPEMIVGIKSSRPLYNGEYYFTTDEKGEPVYMGECYDVHDEFYTDGEFIYAVRNDKVESINITAIDKLQYPIENTASPDFADCQNSDALEFIYDTHMYFLRYDNEDWDSEKQSWKEPEKTAALFYCEDSGLYEAYSVSKQILELTSIEISDYINLDGDHIYSYLPGENYLVSRREYENIKSKTFEMLIKAAEEPEISSGWINIDDVDKWLESLV